MQQPPQDMWTAVWRVARGVLSALGFMALGTGLGAGLGGVLGRLLGAVFTFGTSLVAAPLLGALLGGAFGCFHCIRYYAGCLESLLLYHPRRYVDKSFLDITWDVADVRYTLEPLDYDLPGSGTQTVYLLKPSGPVRRLWVFFGGNAMLAADWLAFCDHIFTAVDAGKGETEVAFLLVDYPGYGRNKGETSPDSVLRTSVLAVGAAKRHLSAEDVSVHLLGHSLGAAAASQLASSWDASLLPAELRPTQEPGTLLLSAPFLDIPEMAAQLLRLVLQRLLPAGYSLLLEVAPLQEAQLEKLQPAWQRFSDAVARYGRPALVALLRPIVPHRWNNVRAVKKAAEAGWKVHVLHGAQDELIPPEMGRQLASLACEAVGSSSRIFEEIPRAGHNDVVSKGFESYVKVMGLLRS